MARPEGERCLVTAARGWVTVHSKRGKLRQRFQSSLPGGSGMRTLASSFSLLMSPEFCMHLYSCNGQKRTGSTLTRIEGGFDILDGLKPVVH
jgi:hypothetical protein